jgi:predicted hydrocarbon binding protein
VDDLRGLLYNVAASQTSQQERDLQAAEVPPELQAVFDRAKAMVGQFFKEASSRPEVGRIEVGGDRYMMARSDSFSHVLRGVLAEIYGEKGSDQILYNFGKAIGQQEAGQFHKRFQLTDPLEKFGVGPTYFSYSGWAFISLLAPSKPEASEDFLLVFTNQGSFEAEAFQKAGEKVDAPVCHISAGYLAGWCQESFGIPLECREIMCRGQSDPLDLFVMAHRKRILAAAENTARLINENKDLTKAGIFGE